MRRNIMNDQHAWTLLGTKATLSTPTLDGVLDSDRPDLGLTSLVVRSEAKVVPLSTVRMLGIRAEHQDEGDVESTDAYTRGDDVIVSCRFKRGIEIGLQIYWRFIVDEITLAVGVEAIVSAQTDLLDSDPASIVTSWLPDAEVLSLESGNPPSFRPLAVAAGAPISSAGPHLFRFAHTDISYLEMVHPSDDRGVTIEALDGHLATRYPVLTERLEKGVIRRSRVRGMFLPIEDDTLRAWELYQRFGNSPPPLTT